MVCLHYSLSCCSCIPIPACFFFFFFFNDTATTEIYTLSLHDALPILWPDPIGRIGESVGFHFAYRSEEHTSELQSRSDLVCRLLLEKKKKKEQISDLPNTKNNTDTKNQSGQLC